MPEVTTSKILLGVSTSHRPVVYVGNFSPPVTGQKFVNQKLADLLIQNGIPLKTLTSLPKRKKDDHFYWSAQVFRIAGLPMQMLGARLLGSRTFVYSLLGGRSQVIDIINVGAARLLGYQITLYHHSSQFAKSRSKAMSMILRLAGKHTNQIMASPQMKQDVLKTYRADTTITIIDNSAYIDPPTPASLRDQSPLRLGLLSNLNRSKGLDTAIETFEVLIDQGCNCELVLAGPAADAEAATRIEAAQRKYPDRIQVLGPVSGERKERFFRDIDVFLFPSTHRHETQSLVVPEAQSFGCPVIVYDHGYVAENIPDNLAQCVVPADRSFKNEAARLVRSWIDDPDLFSAAQNITRDHFGKRRRTASRAICRLASSLQANPPKHAAEI